MSNRPSAIKSMYIKFRSVYITGGRPTDPRTPSTPSISGCTLAVESVDLVTESGHDMQREACKTTSSSDAVL